MSTPTKRRKTNSHKPSPKAVGSLDFFFGKQKDIQEGQKRYGHTQSDTDEPFLGSAALPSNLDSRSLTDEELARKLQNEWDEQDRHKSIVADGSTTANDSECLNTPSGPEYRKIPECRDTLATFAAEDADRANIDHRQQGQANEIDRKKDTLSLQSTASTDNPNFSSIPFDENPLTFDPSRYLPGLMNHWTELGNEASYAILIRCFILVNSTQSRIKIVDTLVNFLRTIIQGDPDSLLPAVNKSI